MAAKGAVGFLRASGFVNFPIGCTLLPGTASGGKIELRYSHFYVNTYVCRAHYSYCPTWKHFTDSASGFTVLLPAGLLLCVWFGSSTLISSVPLWLGATHIVNQIGYQKPMDQVSYLGRGKAILTYISITVILSCSPSIPQWSGSPLVRTGRA